MIRSKNYNYLFTIALGFFCTGWLSTWELGPISISKIFYLFIIISLLLNINNFKNLDLNLINSYFIVVLIYNFFFFNLGYFSEISYSQRNILTQYYLKETVLILFCVYLYNFVFCKQNNQRVFILSFSFFILALSFFLFYLYKVSFKADYIGVRVDYALNALRTGKNTLAQGIMIFFPFILILLLKKLNKLFFFFVFFYLNYFFFNLDSSATKIVLIFQYIIFFIIYLSSKLKINLFKIFSFVIIIFTLMYATFEINDNKNSKIKFSDYKETLSDYKQSHRYRLIEKGYFLSKANYFFGYGTSSYRDPKLKGDTTESHNVYIKYLFEKGLIGLLINIVFYFYLIFTILKKKLNLISYKTASLLSIFNILVVFFFINLEASPILWVMNSLLISIATNKNIYNDR